MNFKLPLRKIFQKHVPGTPRFALSLSWPMVGAISLVLVACVGWSFFMGYMVGSGQNPEDRLEAMTGLKISGENRENIAEEIPRLPEPDLDRQETDTKAEPAQGAISGGMETEKIQEGEPPLLQQAPPPNVPAKNETRRPKAEKAENASAKAESGTRYDYVFQAAVYKNPADANKLRASLEKAGYRASVQKSGKAMLVTVRLRGTEQDAKKFADKLEARKLGKPLRLSRKPVESKKPARGK